MKRTIRTTIGMLAAGVLLLAGVPAAHSAADVIIKNDSVQRDLAGNEMTAQGGSVLFHNGLYYRVGMNVEVGSNFNEFPIYSSPDLINWTYVTQALEPQASGDIVVDRWLGRPDLLFNPSTQKFVLVFELGTPDAGPGNKIAFASADSITGPWTYHGSSLVNGLTVGDHSVFVDGTSAYLVYVGDNATSRNVSMNIAPLGSDWLSVTAPVFTDTDYTREAPFILKVGTKYHFFASGKDWWNSTPTYHRVSTSLTSWGGWSIVATNPASSNTFNTQFDFVLPVTGTAGTSYLLAGDRFSQLYGVQPNPAPTGVGRTAWYPLTFNGDVPTIHGWTDIQPDVTLGTLRGNYVANGRFDQTAATQSPALWGEAGDPAASYTEANNGVTGSTLTHWAATSYNAYTYQTLNLPNGNYTLYVTYRSSGGQTNAAAQVKKHGGADQSISLSTTTWPWQGKSINFTVTTGKAEIAIWSQAGAGQWLNVDEIAVWRN